MRKAVWVTAVLVIFCVSLVGAMALDRPFDSSNITNPTPTPTTSPTITSSTPNPSIVPYDFKIYPIAPSFNLTQGGFTMETITLTTVSGDIKSVNPHDVLLSVDSGSSGIQCIFNSISYADEGMTGMFFGDEFAYGFNSLFTMTVPSSTPTNNYTVTITAKIGSVSHSISMLVSVASSVVTVSGALNADDSGITPYQMQFIDLRNTNQYYATLTGNTYTISIPNNGDYFVRVNDGTALDHTGLWHNVDTFFKVEVPAGSTSITQDFTLGS